MSSFDHGVSAAALRRAVAEVLDEALGATSRGGVPHTPLASESEPVRPQARKPLPAPLSASAIDRIRRATPSRVVQGRTGTRYLTDAYVGLRADHAIALDAVNSEIDEAWAAERGWLTLHSRCQSHEEFLLHPDQGRRLDDASVQKLAAEGEQGVDVQFIAGDGLSAYALMTNGVAAVEAAQKALERAGFRVGRPVFVKWARIGVADHVGTLLQAKATAILVGERPGLGTGDSLSIYTAYGPKLGQDNAEKDCISNIRPLGVSPERAAALCAEVLKKSFAAGGGGVKLVQGGAAK